MINLKYKSYLAAVLVVIPMIVSAETLYLSDGHLSMEGKGGEVPKRGMTQQMVEEKFGSPIMKSTPVGEPPISFWDYGEYHVYFEYDKVLHSVRNISSNQ